MIKHPLAVVAFLLSIESLILFLSHHEKTKKYFQFIPSVFWIYFLPMLVATVGLLDSTSPVYSLITTHLLPASLFILLIPVDTKAIMRLGKPALFMMVAGSVGIMAGTVFSFWLFAPFVGKEFWAGFGALSASWTGGSANMIAVKEAMSTPDRVFSPMVIVDTIVPYLWMGLLVAAVSLQNIFNRFSKADNRVLDDLKKRIASTGERKGASLKILPAVGLILFAVVASLAAQFVSGTLPEIPNVISAYAWTIILVSLAGIGLSFTPVKRIEEQAASKVGYFLLYFVLTSIGAKASIAHIGSAAVLIVAGFVIVAVHVVVLVVAARLLRVPMFLAAVASQANIGGVASAPMVAEIYQPGFASVGLLLAIFGNIVGTYLGIITAQLCRWVVGG